MKGKPLPKKKKPKIWSSDKADKEFSLYIRQRDGRCQYPSCHVYELKQLQCSHYIERRHSATRYDPENCISLCWKHHFLDKLVGFEYAKQQHEEHGFDGRYTQFMQGWLGYERFVALIRRGRTSKTRSKAIIDCMVLLGAL